MSFSEGVVGLRGQVLLGRVGKTVNLCGSDGRLVVAVVTVVLVTIISAFPRASRVEVYKINRVVRLWFPVSDPENTGK